MKPSNNQTLQSYDEYYGCVCTVRTFRQTYSAPIQGGTITSGSSQNGFRKFKQMTEKSLSIGGKIPVQRIPAHMGIKGNDIAVADGEAKGYAGFVTRRYICKCGQKRAKSHLFSRVSSVRSLRIKLCSVTDRRLLNRSF